MTGRSWRAGLDARTRTRLRALHRIEPWRHLKVLALLALWLGPAVVAVRGASWPLVLACWLVMGLSLHGLGVFMHEGAHHNLWRRPALDRAVGFLCGAPVLFSCSAYRATHRLHHRHEHTARDPDRLDALIPSRPLRALACAGFLVGGSLGYTLWITLAGPWRAPRRERILCVLEAVALAALYAAIGWAAWRSAEVRRLVVHGWLGGLAFAIPIANLRGLAEHTWLEDSSELRATRSLPSHPLIRFFFNNQNYHLEHHLFPGIPWYNLPAVHELLADVYRREKAALRPGYGGFAVELATRIAGALEEPGRPA